MAKRGVELEVQRPHNFRRVGLDRRHRGHAGAFAQVMRPHLQVFFAPEPVHSLDVDPVVFEPQYRPRPLEPVTRMFDRIRT
jgi:hypothetical protein